jgi:drug/metabolite transporter (DMT)-like permease
VTALATVFVLGRARRSAAVDETGPASGDPHRAPHRPDLRLTGAVVLTGLFDVSANLTFGVASTASALALVAVLGSVYPAVTVLLARIVHQERLARIQRAGVALTLIGVVLIAGWS